MTEFASLTRSNQASLVFIPWSLNCQPAYPCGHEDKAEKPSLFIERYPCEFQNEFLGYFTQKVSYVSYKPEDDLQLQLRSWCRSIWFCVWPSSYGHPLWIVGSWTLLLTSTWQMLKVKGWFSSSLRMILKAARSDHLQQPTLFARHILLFQLHHNLIGSPLFQYTTTQGKWEVNGTHKFTWIQPDQLREDHSVRP